ncbi:MAG: DUF1016 N-terminal domain-containing protein [Synergistaceae bacterium]|jgi:hypothetical protein|nr:DUF1016 N-terminal domain-containing protein [Synergistaceae bacterium]
MYWDIGEYVSRRVTESRWGKSVVKEFAEFIQSRYVGIKGFSPQNIWRMKQFYETYNDNEKLSTLLRELPWTGFAAWGSVKGVLRRAANVPATQCRR